MPISFSLLARLARYEEDPSAFVILFICTWFDDINDDLH